ncbi:hypothetical protein ACVWY0_000041 [Arthrobacter sp. UYNi723]
MFKKSLAAAGLTVALLFVPVAANALDCSNVSRPANLTGATFYEPFPGFQLYIKGNWAFIVAENAWVFVPPGSLKELEPTAPIGQKGNFQNGGGYALLVNAHCDSNGVVLDNRQAGHGIQLMHGC